MSSISVLVITGWSLREHHCQRAHVQPLKRMARDGLRAHLMTFERPPYRGTGRQAAEWLASLEADGIVWHPIAYHHRPLLLAKLLDGMSAVWAGWRLLRSERIDLLHARSEFPAVIAGVLARLSGLPMLYEHDASISEERVDSGVWRRGGLVYRVTRAVERWLPARAQEMIVLSQRYAQRLRDDGVGVPIAVLPCSTDTEIFQRDQAVRLDVRHAHGWEGRLVAVYSGSSGGWYQLEEMAQFFARLHAVMPATHWLCLINDDPAAMRRLAARHGIPADALTVRSVPAAEVPRWLSAADVGLAFIRAGTSKYASSPNKVAEYLACGLPVIMTPGVGDTEQLLDVPEAGHVLAGSGVSAYDRAIAWLQEVLPQLPQAADVCRRIAVERLSLEGSIEAYRAIYARLSAQASADAVRPEMVEPALSVMQPQEPSHVG